MDPTCPPPLEKMVCDGQAACVPVMGLGCTPLPWKPCEQVPCGEPCQICPPGDPNCAEPPGPKSCDDVGACVPGMFACGAPDAGSGEGGMGGP